MKKIIAATLIATFLGATGLALAQEKRVALSTQELVDVCKLPASPESRSFCIGYATGIYDTYLATRHPTKAKPFICIKQPAPTRDDVIAGYVTWAGQNPQYANQPAADSGLRYLAGRFPCGKR